jgi:Amt family ammonium transporter
MQPDFVEVVRESLEDAGVEAGLLALELTESVLMQAVDSPLETLRSLRALGVRVVLDDFGTGYSSLRYVERFPLDALKLDRAFVAALDESSSTRAVVAAIVAMASALEMPVVGEGLETKEQVTRIASVGCTVAQGFYFARPMPAEDVAGVRRRGVSAKLAAA